MHATTWMKPENIISETSQTQEDRHCMIPPTWGSQNR